MDLRPTVGTIANRGKRGEIAPRDFLTARGQSILRAVRFQMQQRRAFLGAILLGEHEQQPEQFASRADRMEVDFDFRIERSAHPPNAIILNRILLNSLNVAAHDDLADGEGSELIDLIVLLSRKLLSVWTHLQAYQTRETALAEEAAAWPVTKREYSQELYDEFDVFSVQIKSTLDHLVQVMRPILGRNRWTMYSFGDKGERVLVSLQRNTSKHHAAHVRMMEHLPVRREQ